ncbi:hypothetical protein ACH4JZ_01805 [Streptomyces sp. NPDC017615]|uniref:hypothetical protein n=1 Tax=Streptomyces sp. NPDC017615 TaxID=3365003 RepID=UPI0037AB4F2A
MIGLARGNNETAAAYLGAILRPGGAALVKACPEGRLWQTVQAWTGRPGAGL